MSVRRHWPHVLRRRKRPCSDSTVATPFVENSDEGDSSEEECDPDKRRSSIDEFRKRHMFNIPLHHEVPEKTCAKLLKQHGSRLLPVTKLDDFLVILEESKQSTAKTVTADGWKLRAKSPMGDNQFSLCGPSFLAYLKTHLYGYVLCSMTTCFNPTGKTFHAGR